MMETVFHSERSFFLTLTYDNEHIPIKGTSEPVESLDRMAFRAWIKDSKRAVGSYRYYAVGEYGDLSGRPHYHMAIFPQTDAQVAALRYRWKAGFTQAGEMCDERARYLANYTAKKLTNGHDERLRPGQEPEFRLSSRKPPLGAKFADELAKHYSQPKARKIIETRGDIERTWRVGGRIYPIGQWPLNQVRKKLGIPLLHRERAVANPNYLDHHEIEDTPWEPEQAKAIKVRLDGKKTQKLHRSTSVKL